MLYSDSDLIRWDFRNGWKATRAIDGFVVSNENAILMQYTGMKDKNGKEIYEGDIVKATIYYGTSFQSNILGEVIFKDGAFIIETKRGYTILSEAKFIKVIGNIYENLLKEEDENEWAI